MNVLKFTLSGKTAFFKKPDVNTYFYFTYGNIHKIALLGILGAIMGFRGYNQQNHDIGERYPEFYQKLKDIKVGIAPKNNNGFISKKVQIFNNSVGYASEELGGNLIVKEQWLEEPKWDIYILVQGEIEKELVERILSYKFEYIPYLGKNDHIANITNPQLLKNMEEVNHIKIIDSLYINDYFKTIKYIFDPLKDEEYISIYKYGEMLPTTIEETTNKYNLETFVFTNSQLQKNNINYSYVYNCEGKIIFFF